MSNIKVSKGGFASGTSLQGYMKATYSQLVEVFGEPSYVDASPNEKVNCEWDLKVRDELGTHDVTIYNWKDYDGGFIATSNIEYKWHIGGRSQVAVACLLEYFDFKIKEVA
jgi:hypothetical protein